MKFQWKFPSNLSASFRWSQLSRNCVTQSRSRAICSVDLLLHICSLHEATNRRNFVLVVFGTIKRNYHGDGWRFWCVIHFQVSTQSMTTKMSLEWTHAPVVRTLIQMKPKIQTTSSHWAPATFNFLTNKKFLSSSYVFMTQQQFRASESRRYAWGSPRQLENFTSVKDSNSSSGDEEVGWGESSKSRFDSRLYWCTWWFMDATASSECKEPIEGDKKHMLSARVCLHFTTWLSRIDTWRDLLIGDQFNFRSTQPADPRFDLIAVIARHGSN